MEAQSPPDADDRLTATLNEATGSQCCGGKPNRNKRIHDLACLNQPHGADREAARWNVFKYVEMFYNLHRLHQTLEYRSPGQFEAENAPVFAA